MPCPRRVHRWRWDWRRHRWESQKTLVEITYTPATRLRCWLWYQAWLNTHADRPVTQVT